MSNIIALSALALVTILITHWVRRWRNPKSPNGGVLPPGSMGLPLIGETLALLKPSRSFDLHAFIKTRVQRYGPLFKTNVAGRPVIVSTNPEVNNYILMQEGKSVQLWYLDSFSKLFKQDGSSSTNEFGKVHKYIRSTFMGHLGHESLKDKLVTQMEQMINTALQTWSNTDFIQVKPAMQSMVFNCSAKVMISYDSTKATVNLGEKMCRMSKGMMAIPLNIPGTTHYKCLKEQEEILGMIRNLLKEKKNSQATVAGKGDLLDQAVRDMDSEEFMTEDFIVYIMFGALFAATDSTSSALTLAIKLLSQNPAMVDELRAEHEAIIKKRENVNSLLTWDEYKSMTFTLQVINETLRLANVAPGLLRRATKDVQVNGYTIPAGWTILVAASAPHSSENTYKDPMTFNPYRWKDLDQSFISKNFMPFGAGVRQCAGAEFAKALMATFLHVFVTKYRWTKTEGGDNITRKPMLDFGEGFQIKVSPKT